MSFDSTWFRDREATGHVLPAQEWRGRRAGPRPSSTFAAVWNYVYNLGFDRILKRLTGSVHKRMRVRVLHALLFEGGLVVMLVPLIAWWLDISLWEALVADIALVVFYVVFAFVYNLAYDHIFPIPEGKVKPADSRAGP